MKVKITADSTCDLSTTLLKYYNITQVPLYVYLGEEVRQDGITVEPQEIFEFFNHTQQLPKTSAASQYDYEQIFKGYVEQGYTVVHINLSSEFSSCYQNACLAAKEVGNVFVVDSRSLSTGSGYLVLRAAEWANEGLGAKEIVEQLEVLKTKLDVSFVIDTLTYLHKGGRCSSVAALGASLLSLKPCIEVKEGKMEVGKKYRGQFEKCIKNYILDRLKDKQEIDASRVFITHTGCNPEMIVKIREIIGEYSPFEEVIETVAGCTISSHCGPNTLGILFSRK